MVTASIANSYGRDCYVFPGRTYDTASAGCNRLIRLNQAGLITSADDFIEAMMWSPAQAPKPEAIQRSLFLDLNEDESHIVELLAKQEEGVHINTLVAEANMPINRISPILFELELRGIVRPLVGSIYKLIR